MAAPERFAKASDSFPLQRKRRPYMAKLTEVGGTTVEAPRHVSDARFGNAAPVVRCYDEPRHQRRLLRSSTGDPTRCLSVAIPFSIDGGAHCPSSALWH